MQTFENLLSKEYFSYRGIFEHKTIGKFILISCNKEIISRLEGLQDLTNAIEDCSELKEKLSFVLDLENISSIRSSGFLAIMYLKEFCEKLGKEFILFNSQDNLYRPLLHSQKEQKINSELLNIVNSKVEMVYTD
jgi:anti-anti-sigma regulatory factor